MTANAQQTMNAIEPLVLRKHAVAHMLSINVRTLERLRSARRFPEPDAVMGRCPLWRRQSIENWIANGGSR
jgi:predicted DNA-binding transcriptional regulator AlpA